MLFGCMLKAETSLFVEYLSEEESEVALSIVGRIEIKDEIIKNKLKAVIDADFASTELSGDNAVGIALLAKLQMEK